MEIFNRKSGYEGEWRLRETWWWKTAAQKHLSATSENILEEERSQSWESNKRGNDRGSTEVAESEAGIDETCYDGTETGDAWVGK